jgi:hypothetical protein
VKQLWNQCQVGVTWTEQFHRKINTHTKEGNITSIPTSSLTLPFPADFEAGLEAFLFLAFFAGGVAFMKSSDQDADRDKERSGWVADLSVVLGFCERDFL